MPVYLPQIAQPEHCKLWLQPGLSLVGLDHGANLPYNPELYDLSGNNNHCTMYNQAHNEASGYRYDAASGLWVLACDGVDDYGMLAVPNLVKTASKTLQVWAKLTADIRDSYSMVMSLADAQFYIGFRGVVGDTKNCPMFSYRDAAESQKYSAAEVEAIVGEMHLYTWTCSVDGSNVTIKMYIDSTQIYTLTRVTGISATYNPDAYMFTHTPKLYRFGGNIASVLFYDTALSAEEVAANYALGAGGYTTTFDLQPRPNVVKDSRVLFDIQAARADGANPINNAALGLTDISSLANSTRAINLTNFAGTEASGAKGTGQWLDPYCLAFDGVDDYVELGDQWDGIVPVGSDFAIQMWLRVDANNPTGNIGIFGTFVDAEALGALIFLSSNKLKVRFRGNTTITYTQADSLLACNTGEWFLLTATFDRDGLCKIYRGTTVDASDNISEHTGSLNHGTYKVRLGKMQATFNTPLVDIAAARILNYLPTEEEIAQAVAQGPYWPHWVSRVCRSHMEPCASRVTREVSKELCRTYGIIRNPVSDGGQNYYLSR